MKYLVGFILIMLKPLHCLWFTYLGVSGELAKFIRFLVLFFIVGLGISVPQYVTTQEFKAHEAKLDRIEAVINKLTDLAIANATAIKVHNTQGGHKDLAKLVGDHNKSYQVVRSDVDKLIGIGWGFGCVITLLQAITSIASFLVYKKTTGN
jgi:hypothetical protein